MNRNENIGQWGGSNRYYDTAIQLSPLNLFRIGALDYSNGNLTNRSAEGSYWTSSYHSRANAYYLTFYSVLLYPQNSYARGDGFSLRYLARYICYNVLMSKLGKIDISQLRNPPEKHEFLVAKILSNLGQDIVFLPPSNIKGVRQPDFLIGKEKWELKSPKGSSRRTLQNNIHKAVGQSLNIIIDLHRMKINDTNSISQIKFEFEHRKSIHKIRIITKKNELIDLFRDK